MQCSLNGTQSDLRVLGHGHDPMIKPKSSVERPGNNTEGKCKRIAAAVIATAATRTSRLAHEVSVPAAPPGRPPRVRSPGSSSDMEHRHPAGEKADGATADLRAAHFFVAIA